jgi:hypothetical protein
MMIWARRRREAPSAEKWHLIETKSDPSARTAACGTSFVVGETFEHLDLANPLESERCGECQTAYMREMRGG